MDYYTDDSVNHPYILVNFKKYLNNKKQNINWDYIEVISKKYNNCILDAGVWELKKQDHYSWEKWLDIQDLLDSLPENCLFAGDYPCDMNIKFTNLFLKKSWNNAKKYCGHKNYLTTVQSKFKDFDSFVFWFKRYNNLSIENGVMGIGNLCRIRKYISFLQKTINYAFKNYNHKQLHFFGLCLQGITGIRKYKGEYFYPQCKISPSLEQYEQKFNIKSSVDGTNWTRAVNLLLKLCYGASCRKETRQLFFDMYMEEIKFRNEVNKNGIYNRKLF